MGKLAGKCPGKKGCSGHVCSRLRLLNEVRYFDTKNVMFRNDDVLCLSVCILDVDMCNVRSLTQTQILKLEYYCRTWFYYYTKTAQGPGKC